MKVKGIIFEDFVNYKKPSMTIMMPKCDFKCDREYNDSICQNSHLVSQESIDISPNELIDNYYVDNSIVESIVFQGLEPFDTFDDLYEFISVFINKSSDDIVIYTGYYESEINDQINTLINLIGNHNHLIVKFGRFIPDQEPHFDEVLGVKLASNNQYAKVIV